MKNNLIMLSYILFTTLVFNLLIPSFFTAESANPGDPIFIPTCAVGLKCKNAQTPPVGGFICTDNITKTVKSCCPSDMVIQEDACVKIPTQTPPYITTKQCCTGLAGCNTATTYGSCMNKNDCEWVCGNTPTPPPNNGNIPGAPGGAPVYCPNPQEPIGDQPIIQLPPSDSANDIIRAAENMYNAYVACGRPSRFTGPLLPETNNIMGCVKNYLSNTANYTTELATAAIGNSLPDRGAQTGISCSECNGYVNSVITLVEGHNIDLFDAPSKCASLVNSLPDGFRVNGRLYRRLGSGNAVNIYAGDIGVNGDGSCSGKWGVGHILVVKEPTGNTKFTAYESNRGHDCKVYNATEGLPERIKELYTFYRPED